MGWSKSKDCRLVYDIDALVWGSHINYTEWLKSTGTTEFFPIGLKGGQLYFINGKPQCVIHFLKGIFKLTTIVISKVRYFVTRVKKDNFVGLPSVPSVCTHLAKVLFFLQADARKKEESSATCTVKRPTMSLIGFFDVEDLPGYLASLVTLGVTINLKERSQVGYKIRWVRT